MLPHVVHSSRLWYTHNVERVNVSNKTASFRHSEERWALTMKTFIIITHSSNDDVVHTCVDTSRHSSAGGRLSATCETRLIDASCRDLKARRHNERRLIFTLHDLYVYCICLNLHCVDSCPRPSTRGFGTSPTYFGWHRRRASSHDFTPLCDTGGDRRR